MNDSSHYSLPHKPKKTGIREDAQIQEEIHESGEWSLEAALAYLTASTMPSLLCIDSNRIMLLQKKRQWNKALQNVA